jgi:hypothetical protein
MKTIALIFSIMTLITVNSLGQNANIKGLLEKPETRNEIFNTIMNSHELMTDFMNSANGNQHAMMMIRQNDRMTEQNGNMGMNGGNQMMEQGNNMGSNGGNQMMGSNGNMGTNKEYPMMNYNTMMSMMKENPAIMTQMMGNMMKIGEQDSTLGYNMTTIMLQHHAMMQALMDRMNQDGMLGHNGKVK